jgi:hypothetical protein
MDENISAASTLTLKQAIGSLEVRNGHPNITHTETLSRKDNTIY